MPYARVISSDSHVNVRHDDVKARLATRFHDDYDAALMEYARTVFGGNAAKANQAGAEIQHASWGRPGHYDPYARLVDMDTDGVDVEVLYCEVSAYRYLYLLQNGSHQATRAFNDTLRQFNANWMRHIDTDAQGFAVVTLTETELRCVFNKLKPLDGTQAPSAPVVASQTVLKVASGTPDVIVTT